MGGMSNENGQIVIEDGVPIPGSRRDFKFPIKKLEVGQSFVISGSSENASSIYGYWARKLGRKFTCRKIDEKTTRIWRVE